MHFLAFERIDFFLNSYHLLEINYSLCFFWGQYNITLTCDLQDI